MTLTFKKDVKKLDDYSNNNNLIDKIKQTKIKTLETKKNRTINEIDSITKTRKIEIHPNNKQIKILNKWFKECDKVYNYCIRL